MPRPSALSPTLDLAAALTDVRDYSAAYVEDALSPDSHQGLETELAGADYDTMSGYAGVARQEGEVLRLRDSLADYPAIEQLRTELIARIHSDGHGIEGADRWQPNEIDVQRYPANALGITPHLDRKRYHVLVAIFTLTASAPFTICADRSGTVQQKWQVAPRSLILLRAPGFAALEDGRPLHTIAGPESGTRTSISLRMNTRGGDNHSRWWPSQT